MMLQLTLECPVHGGEVYHLLFSLDLEGVTQKWAGRAAPQKPVLVMDLPTLIQIKLE